MIYLQSPRDSFQSFKRIIPTELKIEYYQMLLGVGFEIIDIGSFVSLKAVPQMADTSDVIRGMDFTGTDTKIMAIIGNVRGTETLLEHEIIKYGAYPFSVSEKFLELNLKTNYIDSLERIEEIKDLLEVDDREIIVYLSMSFGNPYDEPWNVEMVIEKVQSLVDMGIRKIMIADTMGFSTKQKVNRVFHNLIEKFTEIEFGFHLHCESGRYVERLMEAYRLGIRWFDSTIGGLGGCPLTGYSEVANLSTDSLISLFGNNKLDMDKYKEAKFFMIENLLKYK